jgi:hypothetical protein
MIRSKRGFRRHRHFNVKKEKKLKKSEHQVMRYIHLVDVDASSAPSNLLDSIGIHH